MAEQNVIWSPHPGSQSLFLPCPADEALISGNRGGGKGLLPEELVATPYGWTTMGELKVGSTISNPDGTQQKVIAVYHREKQQLYKLTFSDGSTIKCDADHLWFAKIANRTKGKTQRNYMPLGFWGSIHRTEDLYNTLKANPHKRPLIPCCDPIKYNKTSRKAPHDPYILGLILGDGSIKGDAIRITTDDHEIQEYLVSQGARLFNKASDRTPTCTFYKKSIYMDEMYRYELIDKKSHDKFIPESLLYGSISDRKALLQGLMDSDGECSSDGKAYYSSVSEELIDNTRTLIQGLGGWATKVGGKELKYRKADWDEGVYKNTGSIGWGLYIRFPEQKELFRLTRKRDRATDYMHGRLVRRVVQIDKLKRKRKTICIVVNNPNRLFVTKDYLVTHNTDVLLMDFLQHVGQGFGQEWRGILFREEYTQLTDIINKSMKWISQIFPGAKYNGSEHKWTFPEGEQLYLRYMRVPSDYWNYHGHEYPWIGFEELTNWATNECYTIMMSCNRSSNTDVPRKYRASCNPSGPGHGWVKQRFIDIGPALKLYVDPESGKTRVNIPSSLQENSTLLEADPTYEKTILAAAADDPVKYKAWVLGEWDIIAGGALTDVWEPKMQVLPTFEIPKSWKIHRSFDWGSTSPWGVTYGAESNGEQPDSEYDIPLIPKGSIIIIDEIYGWTGKVNEGDQAVSEVIAERVLAKDRALELEYSSRVYSGPADTSIYEVRDGTSIGANLASHGCHWKRAYKGSGSRVAGLALIRTMLAASKRWDIEKPGLYFFDRARHHIRTFPLLQYDEKKTEDVDTNQEDHVYDSCRYLLTRKLSKMKRRRVRN